MPVCVCGNLATCLGTFLLMVSSQLMQVVNETLPALVKLREQGLVRFIGITGLPLKIFPYILDRSGLLTITVCWATSGMQCVHVTCSG